MGLGRHALALIAAIAVTAPIGVLAANTPAPSTAAPATGAPAAGAPTANAAPSNSLPSAAAPAEDIRDIRGPKGVFPLWLLAALLAGVTLLIVLGYAAWRWKRRRQLPRPLTALEITLQRLEATRALMHPSTVREFSIAISDIVRGHIEYAFDVTATQRTTEEFLHDLLASSRASLAAHRKLLEEFLHRCDEAKFAGVTLSRQIMERLYESAHRFVIQTSKPPEAVPTQVAALRNAKEAHDSLPST
ncbi:MAG: hypothetical protein ABJD53_08410 [Gammaproteobacteria bacterium]